MPDRLDRLMDVSAHNNSRTPPQTGSTTDGILALRAVTSFYMKFYRHNRREKAPG
jgi:hypothetical protein